MIARKYPVPNRSGMVHFIWPFIKVFGTEIIVIGGNISKASPHFDMKPSELFKHEKIQVAISNLNDQAVCLGASRLFANLEK